jgi:two-component system response regulator MtrA
VSTGPVTPRALVADDDDEIRELVALRLRAAGYEVVEAASADAAVAAAGAAGGVDVAVLDVLMPGDGLRAAGTLRAAHGCAVVMLSALGGAADLRRAYEAGADDYVVKPFDARDLVARVGAACRAPEMG